MLGDNQVWETDDYVMKVELQGHDFRGIIFKKVDGTLHFLQVVIQYEKDFHSPIDKLISGMNFKLTDKSIVCRGL
jgi:hypothetical protein